MKTRTSSHICVYCRTGGTGNRRCTMGHTPQRVFAPKKGPSAGWNRKKN